MRQSSLASFLLSLCLHAGVVAAAFFWPESAKPPVDLTGPVIDVGIYTIAGPGAPSAKAPSAPSAPAAPQTPRTAPAAPADRQTAPPAAPAPETPAPVPVKPDPQPIPQPRPDPPATQTPPNPEPQPRQPEPSRPRRQTENPEALLRRALGDLARDRPPDPGAVDRALAAMRNGGGGEPAGTGTGGGGGDVGILGSYMQSVVSRIKPHWEYVGRADRRNPTAVVEIAIAGDGAVIDAVIVESSGDAAFDGSVLKAVRDTAMLQPPPTPDLAKVRVPFAYESIRAN